MDEMTRAATAVWHPDTGAAQRWFALVCAEIDSATAAGPLDWPDFKAGLATAAARDGFAAETVTAFNTVLEEGNPADTLAMMTGRSAELFDRYRAWIGETEPPPGEDRTEGADSGSAAEDPQAWYAFLGENAQRWDGTDESWPVFREWFVYQAAAGGFGTSAEAFCAYAEANGKLAVWAEYSIPVATAAAPSSAAAERPLDEAEGSAATQPLLGDSGTFASLDEAVATMAPDLIAEFRAENPDLADMSDEDLTAIVAELVSEHG